MKDGLTELELKEREPDGRSPGETGHAGEKRRMPPPSRTRKQPHGLELSVLSLVISIIALLAAGTALFLALRGNQEEAGAPEEETVTFRFGDMTLTPLEGMPLNPYDQEAFSTDEKGRVTYERDGRRAKAGIDVSTHQ